MRYGRGRIIALTILSVTVVLAMFCTGFLLNLRNLVPNAASSDDVYNEIATFDDLYKRIPFSAADTGSIELGQGAKLTLLEESYGQDDLLNFLNDEDKKPFSTLRNKRRAGYPYPVFTNDEMIKIKDGYGDSLQLPVIMLDPYNYDDIVLFELTNLVDVPDITITRDGRKYTRDNNRLFEVSSSYGADQVYSGIPNTISSGKSGYIYDPTVTATEQVIYAADGHTVLLKVCFDLNDEALDGYVVRLKDASNRYLTARDPKTSAPITEIRRYGETTIYDTNGNAVYTVQRNNSGVGIYDMDQVRLGQYEFNRPILLKLFFTANNDPEHVGEYLLEIKDASDVVLSNNIEISETTKVIYASDGTTELYHVRRTNSGVIVSTPSDVKIGEMLFDPNAENQVTGYEIGAVAFNGSALRGMFQEEGLYEISFTQRIDIGNGGNTSINISFAFIIANKNNYVNFPRFDTNNRMKGRKESEKYQYFYEGEVPEVTYHKDYFDVNVKTIVENPPKPDKSSNVHKLKFYDIGEYQMVSSLKYFCAYYLIADLDKQEKLNERGITATVKDKDGNTTTEAGYITLKRYTAYASTLEILGFQARFGENELFYDKNDTNNADDNFGSSDISAWVRVAGETAELSNAVISYPNMSVVDTLNYSKYLAGVITSRNLKPVRTNFPPVTLIGSKSINHAVWNNTILSTVAYLPAYGTGNEREWIYSTFEAGVPFQEAGQYIVVTYFKVSEKLCQQTFYFEIINSVQISVLVDGVEKQLGALEFDKPTAGQTIKLIYGGAETLGKFEALPEVTLKRSDLGADNFEIYEQTHSNKETGAFDFELQPGEYRLTLKYGAQNKSSVVYNFVVDQEEAKGIKANSKAKSLSDSMDVPPNVDIVGAGKTTITWDHKTSGVGYKRVLCEYYQLVQNDEGEVDPNYLVNYDNFNIDIPGLNSAYIFSEKVDYFSDYLAIKTEDGEGWTISSDNKTPYEFERPGLYRFIIIDEVDNETPYVLIIDNSLPTFTQSGTNPIEYDALGQPIVRANMVRFDNNTPAIKVGFGNQKLVRAGTQNVFSDEFIVKENGVVDYKPYDGLKTIFGDNSGNQGLLSQAGILNREQMAICVPLAKIEINTPKNEDGTSNQRYKTIYDRNDQTQSLTNGYYELPKEEGTYYFRATDVLGNVGEYYIILTRDHCFGTVYSEANPVTIVDYDYGIIKESPTTSTCIVDNAGGVTNRPYVYFSFDQVAANVTSHVEKIYLQYYPLTYDTNSALYPFAAQPQKSDANGNQFFEHQKAATGLIFDDEEQSSTGTIRIALFSRDMVTPAGMYILTRKYSQATGEPENRDYYFIVDRQGMLYYDEDKYQTALTLRFAKQNINPQDINIKGKKIADAKTIFESNGMLSSNRIAEVSGFESKYSWKHNSTVYTIAKSNFGADTQHGNSDGYDFDFRGLMPRFSYSNNGQTVFWGEGVHLGESGEQTAYLGDVATRTQDNYYQILITDGSRNISCMLVNGNLDEQSGANNGILTLNLETDSGTKAVVTSEYQKANNAQNYVKTMETSDMQFDGARYWCVVNPHNLEELKFSFNSDPNTDTNNHSSNPASMFIGVDLVKSVQTWSWIVNGEKQELPSSDIPVSSDGVYTFDIFALLENYLSSVTIADGDSLSVSLITYDDVTTNYTILFDSEKPNYNLKQVKAQDNLIEHMNGAITLPKTYVYGLSENFIFEYADVVDSTFDAKRYLDTKEISYCETDPEGHPRKAPVAFKLYEPNDPAAKTFADIVGLRKTEMRYYRITETDYVGNSVDYLVQILREPENHGDQVTEDYYTNSISFVGSVSENGAEKQIGIDMKTTLANVSQFSWYNNSFRFENGDDFYMVLDDQASWKIGNNVGQGEASPQDLVEKLNAWIENASREGAKCSFTLFDRIGHPEHFEFYNLLKGDEQIKLECKQPSADNNTINLVITNRKSLPLIMKDHDLLDSYQIIVERVKEVKEIENGQEVIKKKKETVKHNLKIEKLLEYSDTIDEDVSSELVITIIDPFKRKTITEYHQSTQKNDINFTVYGNTAIKKDSLTGKDILYIGDSRGVRFSYPNTIYSVAFYDGDDQPLDIKQSHINDDVFYYEFFPAPDSLNVYQIVVTGRTSGEVLNRYDFAFDTRLPDDQWTDATGQVLSAVQDCNFVNPIRLNLDFTNNISNTMFPVTVSYTRRHNNQVESAAIMPGKLNQPIEFDQIGDYEVTICNTVWAQRTYNFSITQINDDLVVIKQNDKRLAVSESDYLYEIEQVVDNRIVRVVHKIPNYIFVTKQGVDISEYAQHGLNVDKGQTNREWVRNGTAQYFDIKGKTIIWCLATNVGTNESGKPKYINHIYFATTGVTESPLNAIGNNGVRLLLNGNPNEPTNNYSDFRLNPDKSFNLIYNDYMNSHGGKLTVQLDCNDAVQFDDSEEPQPCYQEKGNTITLDCLYNGILVKTLKQHEVFTINRDDAGYYQFKIHDQVGNCLYFGDLTETDKESVNYRQEYYTLVVMTKPIIEVNGGLPVNNMIYNDQVKLELSSYNYEFLDKYYASLVEDGSLSVSYAKFFNENFYFTKIEVVRNGDKDNMQTYEKLPLTLTKEGSYQVTLYYRVHDSGSVTKDLDPAIYTFSITSSTAGQKSYSLPIYPDMPVTKVVYNNYEIKNFNTKYRDSKGNQYCFDAEDNPGIYEITMQVKHPILNQTIDYQFKLNIKSSTNSARSYFESTISTGDSTTGSVALYYNPYLLFISQGNLEITLLKDWKPYKTVIVNESALNDRNGGLQELFNESDVGTYSVWVRDENGGLPYTTNWEIKQKPSTVGYVILAVVLSIIGIGVLVFIRMRHKMTTK